MNKDVIFEIDIHKYKKLLVTKLAIKYSRDRIQPSWGTMTVAF